MAVQTASHARSLSRTLLRREVLLDASVAVVVFAITLSAGPREQLDVFDALGVGLASLASLALVARRRAPLVVFALTAAASAALIGLGYADQPPGPIVALYFLALTPEQARARAWLTDATVASLFLLHVFAFEIAQHAGYPGVPPFPFTLLFWVGAWVVGDRVRQRRERIAGLQERALRAERDAKRERRLAVAEERARIARDLHDSAGHAINVILVQAGAARLLQERDPERTRAALETIEEVARETIGEIDQLVRALREDGSAEAAGDEVEPPPGLAALDALAERHRAAGLSVTTEVRGSRRPLAPAVDRTSFRILQESLTNAARHGRDSAQVDVAYGPDALELTVTNPTRHGWAPAGGGHGIVGMRERAALLGGSLEAGASDSLFRVRARLPYRGERA